MIGVRSAGFMYLCYKLRKFADMKFQENLRLLYYSFFLSTISLANFSKALKVVFMKEKNFYDSLKLCFK